jgi:hypothetical protein
LFKIEKENGMKKLILVTLFTMLASAGVHAKATIEQAYADDARYHAAIADATKNATRERLREDWDNYVTTSEGVGGAGTVTQYDVRNGERRLQPVNTHVCVVGSAGGYYGRGLKGLDVKVFQRSGYWYLSAHHNSGGSDNWATATCWNN